MRIWIVYTTSLGRPVKYMTFDYSVVREAMAVAVEAGKPFRYVERRA